VAAIKAASRRYLLSLLFVFGTLAIHCLIFIYFLGTGRWV